MRQLQMAWLMYEHDFSALPPNNDQPDPANLRIDRAGLRAGYGLMLRRGTKLIPLIPHCLLANNMPPLVQSVLTKSPKLINARLTTARLTLAGLIIRVSARFQ
jgi:hypothetical protein